ncbi:MAG: hypothetical protein ACRBFS_20910 [Aureispira sp.]
MNTKKSLIIIGGLASGKSTLLKQVASLFKEDKVVNSHVSEKDMILKSKKSLKGLVKGKKLITFDGGSIEDIESLETGILDLKVKTPPRIYSANHNVSLSDINTELFSVICVNHHEAALAAS